MDLQGPEESKACGNAVFVSNAGRRPAVIQETGWKPMICQKPIKNRRFLRKRCWIGVSGRKEEDIDRISSRVVPQKQNQRFCPSNVGQRRIFLAHRKVQFYEIKNVTVAFVPAKEVRKNRKENPLL